ncbi:hypothetical protein BGZ80_009438 [Entomortierella chlamydospora]|uniref:Copper transport protein n=1 Tax=Entomortierella chlamydospora TaxID=101097 RepID=A0A9P6MWH8_9FUNG|nr:hypothetical protein BGZ80_009438 [Entomortierella chlamydospora]
MNTNIVGAMHSMTLHFNLGDNVLFSSWMITGAGGYFGSIIFTIFLATLRVFVSNYVFNLQEKKRKQIEEKSHPVVRLSRPQLYLGRLPLTAIGAFESFLSWVLMLIVMTFNASLLFAAVSGSFIGFLLFGNNGLGDVCGCAEI